MGREKSSAALYFTYNTQLGPPYHIIVGKNCKWVDVTLDTNFINFSIQNKLDIEKVGTATSYSYLGDDGLPLCEVHTLHYRLVKYSFFKVNSKCDGRIGKARAEISSCSEVLAQGFESYLRIAKDPRFQRLPCIHKGTYADDCIVDRISQVCPLFSKHTYSYLLPSTHSWIFSHIQHD